MTSLIEFYQTKLNEEMVTCFTLRGTIFRAINRRPLVMANFSRCALSNACVVMALLLSAGCTIIGSDPTLPSTLGERASGYGYIPLDGLAVDQSMDADSCNENHGQVGKKMFLPLHESLPDISARFAVASIDTSGGLSFGPAKFTAKGKSYRAILDVVNVDAIPVSFNVAAIVSGLKIPLSVARSENKAISGYDVKLANLNSPAMEKDYDPVTIPVYVGVGVRLSAEVTAIEAGIPLVSLSAIGIEAESKNLTGSLTVQAIGLPSEAVAASLTLPSKLDQTTIESGVLAIGASRLKIYQYRDNEGGAIPRIVGLYSPIGTEPALINAIYSELSRDRPKWPRPCKSVPVVASK